MGPRLSSEILAFIPRSMRVDGRPRLSVGLVSQEYPPLLDGRQESKPTTLLGQSVRAKVVLEP